MQKNTDPALTFNLNHTDLSDYKVGLLILPIMT